MVCIFCGGLFHLSQNCETFVSDSARKEFLSSNGWCIPCMNPLKSCRCFFLNFGATKCVTCFSKGHQAIFCPDRFTVPLIFLPKIDNDLILCFYSTLSLPEKCHLTFSSPQAVSLLKPENFTVVVIPTLDNTTNVNEYENSIIAGVCHVNFKNSAIDTILDLANILRNAMFKENVIITLIQLKITKFDFLQLLSHHTIALECNNVILTSEVLLPEILEKIPNIKKFHLRNINIDVGTVWPENVLLYCKKEFEEFQITIKSLDFNMETFVNVLKIKMKNEAMIKLIFNVPFPFEEACEMVTKKFSKYFVSAARSNESVNYPVVLISVIKRKGASQKENYFDIYVLKN